MSTEYAMFRDGKPAVEVKDNVPYMEHRALLDSVPRKVSDALYQGAVDDFWREAGELAKSHGYGDVYSEGRSGGWLIVEKPPVLDPAEQHELEDEPVKAVEGILKANREAWSVFESQIHALMHDCRERYVGDLEGARTEQEAKARRAAATSALSDAQLHDAVLEVFLEIERDELEALLNKHGDPID